MEIAIATAAALALIFGICITVASHYHKDSLVIWFTYFTIVFALLSPFLYWQKREWAKPAPVPEPSHTDRSSSSPTPSPAPSPTPMQTPIPTPTPKPKNREPSIKMEVKPLPTPAEEELSAPASSTDSAVISDPTHRPFYADLTGPKWTDYVEDYFYDAIWRWRYKPAMGQEPRNIEGWCPECDNPLRQNIEVVREKDGSRLAYVYCGKHIGKTYYIRTPTNDARDGIRELIREKLQNGQWKEVVKRQIDAREGRV